MLKKLVVFLILTSILNTATVLAVTPYSQSQVWSKMINRETLLLIDNRPEYRYIEGHIPTAINIEVSQAVDNTQLDLIKNYNRSEVIIYCECPDGGNARIHSEKLEDLGLNGASYLFDSFLNWNYQIVVGPDPGAVIFDDTDTSTEPSPPNVDLLPINLALVFIAGSIIILKKRKG